MTINDKKPFPEVSEEGNRKYNSVLSNAKNTKKIDRPVSEESDTEIYENESEEQAWKDVLKKDK